MNIWTWLNRLVLVLISSAVFAGVALQYWPLLKANQKRRTDIAQKRERIAQLEGIHRQIQGSIDALKADPKAVERAARETLSYAKPGEIVVTFEDPKR